MIEIYGHDARAIDLKALSALLPNLSSDLSRVLSETLDWLTAGDSGPGALYEAYAKAERGRKGLRARLPNNVAGRQRRAEWDPHQHPWPNASIIAGPTCAGCLPTSKAHEPSVDPAAPGSLAPSAGLAN
jgi:hypothetical protein